ncbi:MAG: iron complex transport system ATP-binding protein [Pseudohongiellaceae bacterium]|jgi:iron complex transport system ATP-binding protein
MMTLQLIDVSAPISSAYGLQNIGFDLIEGGVTAIIGPNGAGKTSLLRAICGDLGISSGEILLNGKDTHLWSVQDKALCTAVLPQHSPLDFPFSAHEVVNMGRIPHSTSAKHNTEIVEQALALVDCQHLATRSYITLSGGERQRVQLARVAAQIWEPVDIGQRCLILDEPSASLDLAHQEMVVELFRYFTEQGVAILVVLHDLNLAAKCATEILVLDDGKVAASGTPEQVMTEALLRDVFNTAALVQKNPLSGTPLIIT